MGDSDVDVSWVALGDDGFLVLTPAVLRTTGMPADTLEALSSPELVTAARAVAAGDRSAAEFAEELTRSLDRTLAAAFDQAVDDRFRAAVAWQNPPALRTFASLVEHRDRPRNADRRDRERRLVRYLTRYAAKTETIGFFGPLGLADVTGAEHHVAQLAGPALIRRRTAYLEPWAVRQIGATLAADPEFRWWLPVRRRPHHTVADGRVVRSRQAPESATPLELTLLAGCDGDRVRHELVTAAAAEHDVPVDAAEAALRGLEERRLVSADANIPLSPAAVPVLLRRIDRMPPALRQRARHEVVEPVRSRLAELAAAPDDADAVLAAQEHLAEAFTTVTGRASERRAGRMYAGRTVAYEDCLRDLEVDLGRGLTDRLATALPAIVAVARWVSHRTALAYREHFAAAWAGLGPQRLDLVWFDVLRAVHGSGPRPVDAVLADLRSRWAELLADVGRPAPGTGAGHRIHCPPEEFAAAVRQRFAAPGPGWSRARLHSPDLQLVARGPGAPADGDYGIVLSEMHMSSATVVGPVFEWFSDDAPFASAVRAVLGPQYVPLMPDDYPRQTGRTLVFTDGDGDVRIAFADVEGAPAAAVSTADLTVTAQDGEVHVTMPDGAQVEIVAFLGQLLSTVIIDAWRELQPGRHSPRVDVGEVTVLREIWRADLAGLAFVTAQGEPQVYLALHEWRQGLELPDRVYVKISSEPKPFYLDFAAPLTSLAFVVAARAALRAHPDAAVTVSEALPGPENAWVVDDQGRRYLGELRFTVLDPMPVADPRS